MDMTFDLQPASITKWKLCLKNLLILIRGINEAQNKNIMFSCKGRVRKIIKVINFFLRNKLWK